MGDRRRAAAEIVERLDAARERLLELDVDRVPSPWEEARIEINRALREVAIDVALLA